MRPTLFPRCDSSRTARPLISRTVRCWMRPRPSWCGPRIGDPRLRRFCAADLPWYRSWLVSFCSLGLGLEASQRFAGDLDDSFTIVVAQFVGAIQTLADLSRDLGRRLAEGVLGVRHPLQRHAVEEFCGQR